MHSNLCKCFLSTMLCLIDTSVYLARINPCTNNRQATIKIVTSYCIQQQGNTLWIINLIKNHPNIATTNVLMIMTQNTDVILLYGFCNDISNSQYDYIYMCIGLLRIPQSLSLSANHSSGSSYIKFQEATLIAI